MLIRTLSTLEQPGRVKSFHTMSPTSTGLPTLSVRCSLAQKEGCEALISLPACRYVVRASQILASLGGCLTEELAIQTEPTFTLGVSQACKCGCGKAVGRPRTCHTRGFIHVLVMQAHCWWMSRHEVTSVDKVVIE